MLRGNGCHRHNHSSNRLPTIMKTLLAIAALLIASFAQAGTVMLHLDHDPATKTWWAWCEIVETSICFENPRNGFTHAEEGDEIIGVASFHIAIDGTGFTSCVNDAPQEFSLFRNNGTITSTGIEDIYASQWTVVPDPTGDNVLEGLVVPLAHGTYEGEFTATIREDSPLGGRWSTVPLLYGDPLGEWDNEAMVEWAMWVTSETVELE